MSKRSVDQQKLESVGIWIDWLSDCNLQELYNYEFCRNGGCCIEIMWVAERVRIEEEEEESCTGCYWSQLFFYYAKFGLCWRSLVDYWISSILLFLCCGRGVRSCCCSSCHGSPCLSNWILSNVVPGITGHSFISCGKPCTKGSDIRCSSSALVLPRLCCQCKWANFLVSAGLSIFRPSSAPAIHNRSFH
jgi:hypothetical protein